MHFPNGQHQKSYDDHSIIPHQKILKIEELTTTQTANTNTAPVVQQLHKSKTTQPVPDKRYIVPSEISATDGALTCQTAIIEASFHASKSVGISTDCNIDKNCFSSL